MQSNVKQTTQNDIARNEKKYSFIKNILKFFFLKEYTELELEVKSEIKIWISGLLSSLVSEFN